MSFISNGEVLHVEEIILDELYDQYGTDDEEKYESDDEQVQQLAVIYAYKQAYKPDFKQMEALETVIYFYRAR